MYSQCGGKGQGSVFLVRNSAYSPAKIFGGFTDIGPFGSYNPVGGWKRVNNMFMFNIQPAVKKYPWIPLAPNGNYNGASTSFGELQLYQVSGGYYGLGYGSPDCSFDPSMNWVYQFFPNNFGCNGLSNTNDITCATELSGATTFNQNIGADEVEFYYEQKTW